MDVGRILGTGGDRRVICSWPSRITISLFMVMVTAGCLLIVINFHGIIPRAIAALLGLATAVAAVRSLWIGVTCTGEGFEVREVGTTLLLPYGDVHEVRAGLARRTPIVAFELRRPHRTRFGPARRRVIAHSLGSYAVGPAGVYRRAAALEEILQSHHRSAPEAASNT